CQQYYNIPQSF
nr:immunoglobulin light chain junction region [Macaca mulatta]MPN91733.1 immunoglobulin light chain junction region [Macaca mulatta]